MHPRLHIITGSTRPGRIGPSVAQWATQAAQESGLFEVHPVDLARVGLPLLDEPHHPAAQDYTQAHTQRWSTLVDAADAYIFVTPEYNYFPPASLVNAIQALSKEWAYKPAGVVSYGGISGGLRAAEGLRTLLGNVNVHALPQVVPIPNVWEFLDDKGSVAPNPAMAEGMRLMLGELHTWATALRPIRVPQA